MVNEHVPAELFDNADETVRCASCRFFRDFPPTYLAIALYTSTEGALSRLAILRGEAIPRAPTHPPPRPHIAQAPGTNNAVPLNVAPLNGAPGPIAPGPGEHLLQAQNAGEAAGQNALAEPVENDVGAAAAQEEGGPFGDFIHWLVMILNAIVMFVLCRRQQ
ncbi:unnamed protein product [Peniophora sp. CBMAI 1063]|nr:unnamed protein product [Peniophora sp. CBMAI 1063]